MILSESGESVELWEAPFFEQPPSAEEQLPLAELEAAARAKGFAEGKAEGRAEGVAEAQQIVSRLRSLANEMASPYETLDAVVSRELAELAMQLATRIVRRELEIGPSNVSEIVEQAIGTLYKLDGEVIIFLNPVDAALLRDFSTEALEGKSWKIIEDDSLAVGGCQVKTPSSFVDASVKQQLETLCDSLLSSQESDSAD